MKEYQRIVSNPNVMFGKPVIKGTRVTVELILRKLSAGLSIEEIIQEHPTITREDIREAQIFAAEDSGTVQGQANFPLSDGIVWYCIGTHQEYNKLIQS